MWLEDIASISLEKYFQTGKFMPTVYLSIPPKPTCGLFWYLQIINHGQIYLRTYFTTALNMSTSLFLFCCTLFCFPQKRKKEFWITRLSLYPFIFDETLRKSSRRPCSPGWGSPQAVSHREYSPTVSCCGREGGKHLLSVSGYVVESLLSLYWFHFILVLSSMPWLLIVFFIYIGRPLLEHFSAFYLLQAK